PEDVGTYNTILKTPPISLSGVPENTVTLAFDSSWRDEDNQKVVVEVAFDGGAPVELMRWTSDSADANFHDDMVNEAVILNVTNPAGASEMVISFSMLDAGNDWWWAIDNIVIQSSATVEPTATPAPADPTATPEVTDATPTATPEVTDATPTSTPVSVEATATPVPVDATATPTPAVVDPTVTPVPVEPTATPVPTATPQPVENFGITVDGGPYNTNDTFQAVIAVDKNTAGLVEYNVSVDYNPALLRADSVSQGANFGTPTTDIINSQGRVTVRATQETDATGSLTLFTVNFTVLDTTGGSAQLNTTINSFRLIDEITVPGGGSTSVPLAG
ncbi:hypothetical protein K8I31_10830, partial [bacterium]|nr:hypothetical protein [bacterium]